MGEVHAAHDTLLDRPVAVKRLHIDLAPSDVRREKLSREARLGAQLQHPNIVSVYDVVHDEGADYIVSELVDGFSLKDLLRLGRPSRTRALEILIDVVTGLAYAHSRDVVHRDVKCENVLVGHDGTAKLTDFGIAYSLREVQQQSTSSGDRSTVSERGPIGTVRTMSPEQSRGEFTDARSDLFSFGVLMYEVLSGTSPFACADPKDTLDAIQNGRHRPLAEWDPTTPERLSRLVDRLLEKNQELRPSDAAIVLKELEELRAESLAFDAHHVVPREFSRRRVAVLCVLPGLDPAAIADAAVLAEQFLAFHATVSRSAATLGGEVVSALGGEIVVCFGVDRAHEHDTERAARLATQVLADRSDALHTVMAGARAALDVGDLHVAPGTTPKLVLGAALDNAVRVARALGPGEVVVSWRARSRLAARYQLIPRATTQLRGALNGDPSPWYEVIATSRRAGGTSDTPTPLIGRNALMVELREQLAKPAIGEVRVIALRGEAGVGKSRIVAELLHSIGESATVLVARGVPEHQYSPFAALKPLVRGWLDVVPHDDEQAVRRRILERIPESDTAGDRVAALAVASGAAGEVELARVRSLFQREYQDVVVAKVADSLGRDSRRLLLVVEDAHWFDHSSWSVIDQLVSRPTAGDIRVIVTYRPDITQPWKERTNVSHHDMLRLGDTDARRLLSALVGERELSASTLDRVIEACDGLPLVLEELARSLDGGSDSSPSTSPIREVASSLGDRVAALLEELGPPLRRALETAALLGVSSDRDVLIAACGAPEASSAYVDALVERRLLRPDVEDPARLAFFHPLIRDEVERRISSTRLRDLHGRIVATLDAAARDSDEVVIARHCEAAGYPERAAELWHRAGSLAAARGAHRIAMLHYDRAMMLLPGCASAPRALKLEASIRESCSPSLAILHGWASEEVRANTASLWAIRNTDGQNTATPFARWIGWVTAYASGDMGATMDGIVALEQLAAAPGRRDLERYLVLCARGVTDLHLGRLPEARTALTEALRRRDAIISEVMALPMPEPTISPDSYLAWADLLTGDRVGAFARQRAAETNPAFGKLHQLALMSMGMTLAHGAGRAHEAASRAATVIASDDPLAASYKTIATSVMAGARLRDAIGGAPIDVPATVAEIWAGLVLYEHPYKMRAGFVVNFVEFAQACFALAQSPAVETAARDAAEVAGKGFLDKALHEVVDLDPAIHRYFASEVFRVAAAYWRRHGDEKRCAAMLAEAHRRALQVDVGERASASLLLHGIREESVIT